MPHGDGCCAEPSRTTPPIRGRACARAPGNSRRRRARASASTKAAPRSSASAGGMEARHGAGRKPGSRPTPIAEPELPLHTGSMSRSVGVAVVQRVGASQKPAAAPPTSSFQGECSPAVYARLPTRPCARIIKGVAAGAASLASAARCRACSGSGSLRIEDARPRRSYDCAHLAHVLIETGSIFRTCVAPALDEGAADDDMTGSAVRFTRHCAQRSCPSRSVFKGRVSSTSVP